MTVLGSCAGIALLCLIVQNAIIDISCIIWLDLLKAPLTSYSLLHLQDETRYYFNQLIGAMSYMHRHNIAHRDLKLDNIMLNERTDPPELKVIDFGYANSFDDDEKCMMTSFIGTLDYMSPQVKDSVTDHDFNALWYSARVMNIMLSQLQLY